MEQPSAGPDPGRGALHRALPLVAWLLTLATSIVLFTAWGSGPLAAPPVTDPAGWGPWAADRDPVVATVAVLRLLVLALAWYLVGVTTIGAVARIARIASLVRVADALSVPVVRRVLQTSLGLGLATAVVASSAPGPVAVHDGARTAPAAAAAETPTMHPVTGPPGTAPAPPGMRPLGPPEPPTSTTPAAPRATPVDTPGEEEPDTGGDEQETPEQDAPGQEAVGTPEPSGRTWTVHTGDHLWAIAEEHLGDLLGTSPTDQQVTEYWVQLIEANRDRLVDRDNPDLIVPGQVFVLPEVEVRS